MTSKVENGMKHGTVSHVRIWAVVAAVALVGTMAYQHINKSNTVLQNSGGLVSTQPPHINIKETAQENPDVAVTNDSAPAQIYDHGVGVQPASRAQVQASETAANVNAVNWTGGSSLLVESIRSSRARAHKLAANQRAGVTIQQFSTRLNYQVAATRQKLQLARNQLNQLQVSMHVTKGQPLSKAGNPSQPTISGLKNRIKQLELSLSARHRLQQQSQQQLAMISRHPGGQAGPVQASLAHHTRHQF